MLDVEALCERHLWEQFGGYLANKGGYVISTGPRNGEMLGGGAVLGYVSALMNHAKAKYYGAVTERERDGNVVQFFTCVNQKAHTESWTWYKSLRANLNRIVFQRKKEAGEDMNQSKTHVYHENIAEMSRAYSLHNSKEGAIRKCSLIGANYAVGRSASLGWLSDESLVWDPKFRQLFGQLPQAKTSQSKTVGFCASASPHLCFFAALGHRQAVRPLRPDPDAGLTWIFSELHPNSKGQSSGRKIGQYMKDVAVGTKSKFQKCATAGEWAAQLDFTGAGIRPAAINELSLYMPAEFVTNITGQHMAILCAMYEYMDATLAMLQPALVVLAGFQPLPFGRLGKGPAAASLRALLEQGVDMLKVKKMLVLFFELDASAPPSFREGEKLFPMMKACFASVVMHYEEQNRKGEMTIAFDKLRLCWIKVFRASGGDSSVSNDLSHKTIVKWGNWIRLEFETDLNGHLLLDQASPDISDVVSRSFTLVTKKLSSLSATVGSIFDAFGRVNHRLDDMQDLVARAAGSRSTAASLLAASSSLPRSEKASPPGSQGSSRAAKKRPAPAQKPANLGLLGSQGTVRLSSYSDIVEFVTECHVSHGGNLPHKIANAKDKSKGRVILKCMQALATPVELALLKNKMAEQEAKRKVVLELHDCLAAFLVDSYDELGVQTPGNLAIRKGKGVRKYLLMKANALDDHKKRLKQAAIKQNKTLGPLDAGCKKIGKIRAERSAAVASSSSSSSSSSSVSSSSSSSSSTAAAATGSQPPAKRSKPNGGGLFSRLGWR